MDFLESAVSAAKEAIDIACKKTNDAVIVGRQKFDIASLENKRAKEYEILGKICYNELINEEIADETVEKLVLSIKTKTEKIEKLRKEINEAKNKRICPSCNTAIDDTATFCSNCGEQLNFTNEGE